MTQSPGTKARHPRPRHGASATQCSASDHHGWFFPRWGAHGPPAMKAWVMMTLPLVSIASRSVKRSCAQQPGG